MDSATQNRRINIQFIDIENLALDSIYISRHVTYAWVVALTCKAKDIPEAHSTKKTLECKFLIFLVLSCQIAFVAGLPAANASSTRPSKIKVDALTRNACYEWKDEFVSPQSSGSPMPPAFYGLIAKKVNCSQRHHFQVISIDSRERFIKAKSSSGSSMKYCQKKLSESKYYLLENQKLNWSLMEILKSAKSYSCFVTGKVSVKPGSQKVFFYEELYNSLSDQSELGDQK